MNTPRSTSRFTSHALLTGVALGSAVFGLAGIPESRAAARDDVALLTRLDAAMQKAVVDIDTVAFAGFLTDDYKLVVSSSRVVGKAEVVAELGEPDTHLTTNASSNLDVRVHGDTAIVIADLHQAGQVRGKPVDYWVRYTDTWIRVGDSWRCVSGHATRLATPAT